MNALRSVLSPFLVLVGPLGTLQAPLLTHKYSTLIELEPLPVLPPREENDDRGFPPRESTCSLAENPRSSAEFIVYLGGQIKLIV